MVVLNNCLSLFLNNSLSVVIFSYILWLMNLVMTIGSQKLEIFTVIILNF